MTPARPRRPAESSAAETLAARLADAPVVGVVGLGYVGLPLAIAFAESGATVVGVDLDAERVARIGAGQTFIEDVSPTALGAMVRAGRLTASGDYAPLAKADAIVICVPTPLRKTKEPDVRYVVGASDAVAGVARRGQLVVLESTTYPGTTEQVLAPRLEARGLVPGRDVFLAFSPERIDPGNRQHTLRTIPKVVGGLTPACTALARALYGRITPQVVSVSSPAAAEMVKLLENTFRSVNIALANEFAIMCRRLGLSVWEIIGAAATKPFGFMPFFPGPGLGGHCLPSDPHYLSWRVRLEGYEPRFIAFADEINTHMPEYVVQMVVDALNDRGRPVRDTRILVLGRGLQAQRSRHPRLPRAGSHRPAARQKRPRELPRSPRAHGDRPRSEARLHRLAVADLSTWDVVLVLTPHASYDWPAIVRQARLVIDIRNATAAVAPAANIIRL